MKQILAIFRKDARHFWPEILISLALQASLVVLYPRQWHHLGFHAASFSWTGIFYGPEGFASLLVLLIPISWWVLLARLVHEERLVGHTQFWVTRPYQWPLLLGAKLLFVAAFAYLPFLIVQCIVLRTAGFHPLSHVPGLLFNALLLTGILILPLMALSALTSNIARMTLAILGVLVYFAGIATVAGLLPRLASSPDLISGFMAFAVLLCGTVAVILVQYSRSRTLTAWLILASAALLLGSSAFYDADQPFMNRYYPPPAANAAPPALFTYGADAMKRPFTRETGRNGIVEISLPVNINGVAAGSVVMPTAVKVTLDAPGASHWESPWQRTTDPAGLSFAVFSFKMRRQTFEQFRTGPVALHMTFAVDQARTVRENTIPLPESAFEVPGFARCIPETGWDGHPITTGIGCLSPMHQPDLTFITVLWHDDDCRSQNSDAERSIQGFGWAGSLNPLPADFSLTSVWDVPLGLTNSFTYGIENEVGRVHMRQLCPGSPVSFTTYALETRTRAELSIPDFRLPEITKAARVTIQTR